MEPDSLDELLTDEQFAIFFSIESKRDSCLSILLTTLLRVLLISLRVAAILLSEDSSSLVEGGLPSFCIDGWW